MPHLEQLLRLQHDNDKLHRNGHRNDRRNEMKGRLRFDIKKSTSYPFSLNEWLRNIVDFFFNSIKNCQLSLNLETLNFAILLFHLLSLPLQIRRVRKQWKAIGRFYNTNINPLSVKSLKWSNSNNSSSTAECIVWPFWVCLTIFWSWRLKS